MKTSKILSTSFGAVLLLLAGSSCNNPGKIDTTGDPSFINVSEARPEIEAVNNQFSVDFMNKDSVALANHYASDGMLGLVKGKENLVSAWGKMIRDDHANGKTDVQFETNSLASDDEFVVELGIYRLADKDGNIKNQGKYVVVWKKEGGEWKIYRDTGL